MLAMYTFIAFNDSGMQCLMPVSIDTFYKSLWKMNSRSFNYTGLCHTALYESIYYVTLK